MASSSSTANINPLAGLTVAEKLTKTNFASWKAQVKSAVCGAMLEDYLTGANKAPDAEIIIKGADGKEEKKPNPAYALWRAQDQQVLSYLLSNISPSVLTQVNASETAAEAWRIIEGAFSSQSRARAVNVRMALSSTKKGSMTATEYYTKMKNYGDDMAAAGRRLKDDELVEYILAGLDEEFSPLVSSLITRTEPVSLEELFSQLLAFETHLELLYGGRHNHGGSANYSGRGRGGSRGGRSSSRGRGRGPARGDGGFGQYQPPRQVSNGGRHGGYNRGGNSSNYNQRNLYNTANDKTLCQVCFKPNHTAAECWHRFEEDFVPDKRLVAAANRAPVDPTWYTDTGASDHITGELEKLHIRDKYYGTDQIHTASGSGMNISHIGHATIHTPSNHDIHLRNILHVPEAQKNLISVHRLATDNNVFLEFHPNYFLVKDQDTKKVILEGQCRHGLYPFPAPSNKKAYITTKVPFSRWHSRLGHPSSAIVKQVISRNKLPLLGEASCSLVCDACQQAKSHQLPYTRSDSKSSSPLELIFSDVWGPAIESVGRYRYYVSFIDDFSKFT